MWLMKAMCHVFGQWAPRSTGFYNWGHVETGRTETQWLFPLHFVSNKPRKVNAFGTKRSTNGKDFSGHQEYVVEQIYPHCQHKHTKGLCQ